MFTTLVLIGFQVSFEPAMEHQLDSVFGDAGVDPALASSIISDGWTIQSYREIVAAVSDFTDAIFEELCPNTNLSLLQKASLKGAWRSLQGATDNSSGSAPSSSPGAAVTSDNTWAETFPPKLNSSTVSALKQRFSSNFPSEVLTPETQPSARLLALAQSTAFET